MRAVGALLASFGVACAMSPLHGRAVAEPEPEPVQEYESPPPPPSMPALINMSGCAPALGWSPETAMVTLPKDAVLFPRSLAFNPLGDREVWLGDSTRSALTRVHLDESGRVVDISVTKDRAEYHYMDNLSSLSFTPTGEFATCQESVNVYKGEMLAVRVGWGPNSLRRYCLASMRNCPQRSLALCPAPCTLHPAPCTLNSGASQLTDRGVLLPPPLAQNFFMGPTLYDTAPRGWTSSKQEPCAQGETCFLIHTDMLHESPLCMGIAHDNGHSFTAGGVSYRNVFWAFGGGHNQLVRP